MNQKIKIMKRRQQLSDEEIQSYMNFDRVLESRKAVLNSARTISMLKWGGAALLITSLAVWFFLAGDETSGKLVETSKESDGSVPIHAAPQVMPADSLKSEEQREVGKVVDTARPTQIAKPRAEKPVSKDPEATRESEYLPAEPVEGYSNLYDFFSLNLEYPADAIKDSVQGVETISFVINAAGKPEQVEVVNSLGDPFDTESRRLIENMPAWKPATLNGKPVASKVSLPITFRIQKIKN